MYVYLHVAEKDGKNIVHVVLMQDVDDIRAMEKKLATPEIWIYRRYVS